MNFVRLKSKNLSMLFFTAAAKGRGNSHQEKMYVIRFLELTLRKRKSSQVRRKDFFPTWYILAEKQTNGVVEKLLACYVQSARACPSFTVSFNGSLRGCGSGTVTCLGRASPLLPPPPPSLKSPARRFDELPPLVNPDSTRWVGVIHTCGKSDEK